MKKEVYEGATPAGGVRAEIYYHDDNGNAVDKEEATQSEIVEFDAQGNVIARTHATMNPDEVA